MGECKSGCCEPQKECCYMPYCKQEGGNLWILIIALIIIYLLCCNDEKNGFLGLF